MADLTLFSGIEGWGEEADILDIVENDPDGWHGIPPWEDEEDEA